MNIPAQIDLLIQKVDQIHNLLSKLDEKILYISQQQQTLQTTIDLNKNTNKNTNEKSNEKSNKRFCSKDRIFSKKDIPNNILNNSDDLKRKTPLYNITKFRQNLEKEEKEKEAWLLEEKERWKNEQEELRLKMEEYHMSYIL